MSEKSQLILMAKYNTLMNQRMVKASGYLSKTSLNENKGAFFKSVIGTLNHIMIGDILWLKRFSAHTSNYVALKPFEKIENPKGLSAILIGDLPAFSEEREKFDRIILEWCNELEDSDLDTPLQYVNFKGEKHKKRLGDLILHLFLHQIHHRGQITTLLSQENIDFGETDLPELVPDIL